METYKRHNLTVYPSLSLVQHEDKIRLKTSEESVDSERIDGTILPEEYAFLNGIQELPPNITEEELTEIVQTVYGRRRNPEMGFSIVTGTAGAQALEAAFESAFEALTEETERRLHFMGVDPISDNQEGSQGAMFAVDRDGVIQRPSRRGNQRMYYPATPPESFRSTVLDFSESPQITEEIEESEEDLISRLDSLSSEE